MSYAIQGPNHLRAVTPSDTVALTHPCSALYVGATGDVTVLLQGDSTPVKLVGLAAGIWHPMYVTRVDATGTTATGIVAGWYGSE